MILVGHSQGNILINRVAEGLFRQNPTLMGRLAVVGVGVADDRSAGTYYRYVTNSSDKIISAVSGALPANFSGDLIGAPFDLTKHTFVGTYLSNWKSVIEGEGTIRNRVATRTKEAFDLVRCVETELQLNSPIPANARIGVAVDFTVRVIPKNNPVGFGRSPTGTVSFVDSSGATLCAASVDRNTGLASCAVTFSGAARTEPVQVRFVGKDGYIDSLLSQDIQLKRVDEYVIEIATLNPSLVNQSYANCTAPAPYQDFPSVSGSNCLSNGNIYVRCTGPGCVPDRLWVTTSRRFFVFITQLFPPYIGDTPTFNTPLVQYGSNDGTFPEVPTVLFYPPPANAVNGLWVDASVGWRVVPHSGASPDYSVIPFYRNAPLQSGVPPPDRGVQAKGFRVTSTVRVFDTYLERYEEYTATFTAE